MKPLVIALQAVVGTAMLAGCAGQGDVKPEVRPYFAVRDGGAKADDYYQLGRHYQSKERLNDAETAYRRAIALDESMAEAHSALGAIQAANRRFEEAYAELSAAIALNPTAVHYRNNLGYAYYLQGRADEAVVVFEAAARLDASNPRIWNNLGLALAQLGRADAANHAFARAGIIASGGTPPASPALSAATSGGQGVPETLASALAHPVTPLADWELVASIPAATETFVEVGRVHAVQASEAPGWQALERIEPGSAVETAATWADAVIAATAGRFEPSEPIAPDWVASAEPPATAIFRTSVDSPALGFLGPAGSDAGSPAFLPSRSVPGTLILEVPSEARLVELAPHVVELEWSATILIARPAAAIANDGRVGLRLEVSNGNGVTGMARRVGNLLGEVGLPATRLTNQEPYTHRATEIHYRDGHEAEAATLSAWLPGNPVPVRSDGLRADVDVRLLLGRDLPHDVALVEPPGGVPPWVVSAPSIGANAR